MRHKKAGHRLSRSKDQRAALRRVMIKQLFTHERIRTTRAKADAIRGPAERLITLAKRGNDASARARGLGGTRYSDSKAKSNTFLPGATSTASAEVLASAYSFRRRDRAPGSAVAEIVTE